MKRIENERRGAARKPLKSPAMVRQVAGPNDATVVHVRDISETGIGFHAPAPLELAGVYRVDICDRTPRPAGTRAEVRSCRMLVSGDFHVGAQFC